MALPERACLLVNRRARRTGDGRLSAAARALADGFRLEVLEPDGPAAALAAARDAAAAGALVIAAGGDGTVACLLEALAAGAAPLGILPLGTANDLAAFLGLPADPVQAARRLAGATERRMDLVRLGARRFVTVGGLGLPAECALAATRARDDEGLLGRAGRALGTGLYRAAAVAEIARSGDRATRIEITWVGADGEPGGATFDDCRGLFLANLATLGGGLAVAPAARPDDGLCEVVVLGDRSRAELVATLGRLALGDTPPGLGRIVMRSARITVGAAVRAFGDGEDFGTERAFDVQVEPGSLRVLA